MNQVPKATALSRRGFLGRMAAAAAAALVPRPIARMVADLPAPQRACGVLDLTTYDAILRDYYSADRVAEMASWGPSPLLAMIKKRRA